MILRCTYGKTSKQTKYNAHVMLMPLVFELNSPTRIIFLQKCFQPLEMHPYFPFFPRLMS